MIWRGNGDDPPITTLDLWCRRGKEEKGLKGGGCVKVLPNGRGCKIRAVGLSIRVWVGCGRVGSAQDAGCAEVYRGGNGGRWKACKRSQAGCDRREGVSLERWNVTCWWG